MNSNIRQIRPDGAPCPISTRNLSVGKALRYQSLLDICQSELQEERVRLFPQGTSEDSFTHTLLRKVQCTGTSAVSPLAKGSSIARGETSARPLSSFSPVMALRAGIVREQLL